MLDKFGKRDLEGAAALDGTISDALVPLRVTGRLAEQAYQAIRSAIQEGRLEPGQRVREVELSEWLGMSRTPIREALRRLQSDNMVVHAPGGGLAIAQHDLRAIAELYDMRESLEGTAAGLAARHAGPSELIVLQAMLAGAQALPNDPVVHARANTRLHEHIYRAAHNRFLLKQVGDLHDAVALLGRTTFAADGRIAEAWAEHDGIVAAIAGRNPKSAEQRMRQHVRRALELRLKAMVSDAR